MVSTIVTSTVKETGPTRPSSFQHRGVSAGKDSQDICNLDVKYSRHTNMPPFSFPSVMLVFPRRGITTYGNYQRVNPD